MRKIIDDGSINYDEAQKYIKEANIEFDFSESPTCISDETFSSADYEREDNIYGDAIRHRVRRLFVSPTADKVTVLYSDFITRNNGYVRLEEFITEFEENLGKVCVTSGRVVRSNYTGENYERLSSIDDMRNLEGITTLFKTTIKDSFDMPSKAKLLNEKKNKDVKRKRLV